GSSTILGVAEEALKNPLSRSIISSGLGMIPGLGGVLKLGVDKFVSGLQETASALKNSQSLLNGQVTELQAGLQEAKDRELELAAAQQRLA
ncbi:3249_t:CDS:2, partial [Paraglomus occultum]